MAAFVAWDYLQREAMLREQIRQMQEVISRLNAEYRVAQVLIREQGVDVDDAQLDRLAAVCRELAAISDREAAG